MHQPQPGDCLLELPLADLLEDRLGSRIGMYGTSTAGPAASVSSPAHTVATGFDWVAYPPSFVGCYGLERFSFIAEQSPCHALDRQRPRLKPAGDHGRIEMLVAVPPPQIAEVQRRQLGRQLQALEHAPCS